MASHHGRLQGWRGGYSRAEDMDRASRGKLSPRGKSGSQFPSAGIRLPASMNLIRLSLHPVP